MGTHDHATSSSAPFSVRFLCLQRDVPGKESWLGRKSRSKVHALVIADAAVDVMRELTKNRVVPRCTSLDETVYYRRDCRGCGALGYVTPNNNPPADGALPADRHDFWDIVGGHYCAELGVVAAHY